MLGLARYKVMLAPYDPTWRDEFEKVKRELLRLWKGNVTDIQHIGSTSIVGMPAKPILDIAVVFSSYDCMDVSALTDAGYDFCGIEENNPDRYLFVLRTEDQISLHHIHCYLQGSNDYYCRVGFRDYLNTHPEKAREYAELKQRLALRFPDDRVAYCAGKTEFIQSIYALL